MNKLIAVLSIALLSGCAYLLPGKVIEPEFQPYYDLFMQEAARHGVKPYKEVSIIFGDLGWEGRSGNCNVQWVWEHTAFKPLLRTITIDTKTWKRHGTYHPNCQEMLIFHELGHCGLLRMSHNDNWLPSGDRESIMSAVYVYPDDCDIYMDNRDYYLKELFGGK